MKKGICVICNAIGELTVDHAPPKSVSPRLPLEILLLPELINKEMGSKAIPKRGFQSPTYPSLCARCNNDLLGAEYDPVLASFALDVMTGLRAHVRKIIMPDGLTITTKPMRLARAVIGHLLAAEHRKDLHHEPLSWGLYDKMRSFFLNANELWPEGLHLTVWPYNDKKQFISRTFSYINVFPRTWGPVAGDVMKFCPVAFWISDTSPAESDYNLTTVPMKHAASLDSDVTFKIEFNNLPTIDWPQAPGDKGIVLMAPDRTSVARPVAIVGSGSI